MNKKLSYSFPAKERLKSRLLIHHLFEEGKVVDEWPVRCLYTLAQQPQPSPIQVGVTVSKRQFPHATDRNRIKRLLREAWRLNQHQLNTQHMDIEPNTFCMMFLYSGKKMPSFHEVEGKIRIILSRLSEAAAHHREMDR